MDFLAPIEIYKGDHNKTYLVTMYPAPTALRKIARERFKVSNSRIMVCTAWILNDELYLEYPENKKAARVWTAYIMKKEA